MTEKIALVIPCYNEESTIGKVISDFKKEFPDIDIYICDNNSTDRTSEIATENGGIVINEYRGGKGNAVLRIFKEVDADIYILVDGDDTYPAKNVKQMICELKTYDLDMVVGDRLSNGSYTVQNKRKFHGFGNNLIKSLINNFFGSDLKDILSGYRVFSKSFVKNYATLAQGFELETDMSIFALNYEMRIREIPIFYKERPEGSESKLNTFKDGFRVIRTFFNLYRFYRPFSFFTYLSVIVLIIALILGSFPIHEYIKYDYVFMVPTAILSGFLVIVSLLFFLSGLILDTIIKIDKKNILLNIRNFK